MGFARDTPITDDDDLFDIAFEQEITNALRQTGETTFVKLHTAAVNFLIRDLPINIDATLVTNTYDFKFELVYWILKTLYFGEEPDALGRRTKFDEYTKQYEKQVATRRFLMTDGSVLGGNGQSSGLPMIANHDSAAYFPGMESGGPDENDRTYLVRDPLNGVVSRPRT